MADGNSNDGSKKEIVRFASELPPCHSMRWVSERDSGIYDAMNKGLSMSSGEYIGFLNSGDVFSKDTILHQLYAKINSDGRPEAVFGDVRFLNNSGETVRYWRAGNFKRSKYLLGWMTPHPSTFIKREVYVALGNFNPKFRIAGDYDLMLKIFLQ